MPKKKDRLITRGELAKIIKRSVSTVRKIEGDAIPIKKIGANGERYFSERDALELAKQVQRTGRAMKREAKAGASSLLVRTDGDWWRTWRAALSGFNAYSGEDGGFGEHFAMGKAARQATIAHGYTPAAYRGPIFRG